MKVLDCVILSSKIVQNWHNFWYFSKLVCPFWLGMIGTCNIYFMFLLVQFLTFLNYHTGWPSPCVALQKEYGFWGFFTFGYSISNLKILCWGYSIRRRFKVEVAEFSLCLLLVCRLCNICFFIVKVYTYATTQKSHFSSSSMCKFLVFRGITTQVW